MYKAVLLVSTHALQTTFGGSLEDHWPSPSDAVPCGIPERFPFICQLLPNNLYPKKLDHWKTLLAICPQNISQLEFSSKLETKVMTTHIIWQLGWCCPNIKTISEKTIPIFQEEKKPPGYQPPNQKKWGLAAWISGDASMAQHPNRRLVEVVCFVSQVNHGLSHLSIIHPPLGHTKKKPHESLCFVGMMRWLQSQRVQIGVKVKFQWNLNIIETWTGRSDVKYKSTSPILSRGWVRWD